jgi:hypothetical protein
MSINTVIYIEKNYTSKEIFSVMYKVMNMYLYNFEKEETFNILNDTDFSVCFKNSNEGPSLVRIFKIEDEEKIHIFCSYFDGFMIPYMKEICSYFGGTLVENDEEDGNIEINIPRDKSIASCLTGIDKVLDYNSKELELYKIFNNSDIIIEILNNKNKVIEILQEEE